MANHLEQLVIKTANSGQVMTATRKVFESIYRDKGFEIVSRSNVEPDGRADKPRSTRLRKGEPESVIPGSAADVAGRLGLDTANTTPEPASGSGTPNAALSAAAGAEVGPAKTDAIETDIDVTDIDDERKSNRRDRGRVG